MTSPTPRVWIVTFLSLVFTIGVLAGIVLERTVLGPRVAVGVTAPGPGVPGGPGRGGPNGPGGREGRGGRGAQLFGPPPEQYVANLDRAVRLTDAQRRDILALLQAQETRLRELQDDARNLFVQEQTRVLNAIAALLTPEQAATFRTWSDRQVGRRGGGRQ